MGYCYSSYYQSVLGWNLIGNLCSQLFSYAGLVVYKPNNKIIINGFIFFT